MKAPEQPVGVYEGARRLSRSAADRRRFQDVVDRLEEEGLPAFAESWDELIASVTPAGKGGAEVSESGSVAPIDQNGHTHAATQASASPA